MRLTSTCAIYCNIYPKRSKRTCRAFNFISKWSSLITVAFLNDCCIKPRRHVGSVDSIQPLFMSQTLNARRCDLIQCGSRWHNRLGQGKHASIIDLPVIKAYFPCSREINDQGKYSLILDLSSMFIIGLSITKLHC